MKKVTALAAMAWLIVATALACSSSGSSPETPGVTPDASTDAAAPSIPVAANQLPSSDPKAPGQAMFLNETWGLEKLNTWPPTAFMLDLIKSEPDVFGNQFASFGFLPDPNDDLPIGFKRGTQDPTRVFQTCASCHTGTLPDGRVWFGQPATSLDIGRFSIEVDKRWVAAGNPSKLTAIGQTKNAELGPGRIEAEGSESDPLVPDDIPVIYDLAQRQWLSKMGTTKDYRSEVYLSLFGFGAGYPDDNTGVVPFPSDATLAPFLAFFGFIDPPSPPAGGDATLIAAGKAVYQNAQCDSCHQLGNLGNQQVVTLDLAANGIDRLPGVDMTFPRGSVHTSPIEWSVLEGSPLPDAGAPDSGVPVENDAGFGDGFQAYINFIVRHDLKVSSSDGYVTPDIRALWASGPYLHNGSIGSLADLLNVSSARPTSFVNHGFTVDMSADHNANYGHEFGATLSDTDKAALVAYLNSL